MMCVHTKYSKLNKANKQRYNLQVNGTFLRCFLIFCQTSQMVYKICFLSTVHLSVQDTVKILIPYNFTTSKIRCNFFPHFFLMSQGAVLQALLLIKTKARTKHSVHQFCTCTSQCQVTETSPSLYLTYLLIVPPTLAHSPLPHLQHNTRSKCAATLEMSHSKKKKVH